MQLGIDAKKSDQVVRGAVVMPNGTGKTKRVAVFAQGAKAEEAKAAGADIVGMDDLAAEVKAGNMDFDVVIASPDTMRVVGTLGQILGPRGLMPNPKVGTVTPDVATGGARTPRPARCSSASTRPASSTRTIGRRSFESDKLRGNLRALIDALNKAKPATSKGIYLRKVARVVDDGRRCPRRHRVDQRSGHAGLSEGIEVAPPREARGEEMVGSRRSGNRAPQVIEDRWWCRRPNRGLLRIEPAQMAVPPKRHLVFLFGRSLNRSRSLRCRWRHGARFEGGVDLESESQRESEPW